MNRARLSVCISLAIMAWATAAFSQDTGLPRPPALSGSCAEKNTAVTEYQAQLKAYLASSQPSVCGGYQAYYDLGQTMMQFVSDCPMFDETGQAAAAYRAARDQGKAGLDQVCSGGR